MQAADLTPVVEVTRGDVVESIHWGAYAVVDQQGLLLASGGNPDLVTYPRSSMKPLQAIPFFELGGDENLNFTDEEKAILCASHSGTDAHVLVLNNLQSKIGIQAAQLLCGVHQPYDKETALAMAMRAELPNQNRHNCSGKHTGMLAQALIRQVSFEHYLELDHPVQLAIREAVAQMCDIPPQAMPVGVDGCSAPVYAIALKQMALAFARMAQPDGLPLPRASACQRITQAMMSAPVMVAGEGRFDTALMRALPGKVFSKAGAEGYQCIGIMPGVLADGSPGVGVAVKISDGDASHRAVEVLSLQILCLLGLFDAGLPDALGEYAKRAVLNWRKLEVGELRPVIQFQKPVW